MRAAVRVAEKVELKPSVEVVRPPLKWAGGKRWQVPHLAPLWEKEKQRRLVEPFAGGLAVALGLRPERAWLNDVNPHLINLYVWLKRGLTIEQEFQNDEKAYYRARVRFNALLQEKKHKTAEAAGLFYYLNRTGYNGLCRFNASGGFNVPFGRYASIGYKYEFPEFVQAFRDWTFTNSHFSKMTLADDDFVYADPPYDVQFTTYSMGGFDWDDQVATATWLSKHPGPVVLSNQATVRIIELYKRLNYNLILMNAPRRISCTGDRTPASEVIATRNL